MDEVNRTIFSGMQVLFEGRWVSDKAVVVEDQIIKTIIPVEMIKNHMPAHRYEFAPDYRLIPGLIDLHIHGTHGHDVMDGSEESLFAISKSLAEEGVTGFLATTMTAEKKKTEAVLKLIAATMQKEMCATILGVHLEGPFIAKEKRGAQMSEYILLPDVSLLQSWQKLADDTIKIVTLAPELRGGDDMIAALRKMGIVASMGHTNATFDEACAAITAGCTHATHLFNAMSEIHQRHPGVVGAILVSDRMTAEIVVDGVHLHPAIVELIYRIKGREHLLLVTDAMCAKCIGDGEYKLGGQTVHVTEGKAKLKDGTLAGSTLSMLQAVRNMQAFSRCELADAIGMATLNPARALGIGGRKGTITAGKDADLVVLDADFNVHLTMCTGREVYRR